MLMTVIKRCGLLDDTVNSTAQATFTEKHPEAKGDILHVELV